jgi:hypothetical protein
MRILLISENYHPEVNALANRSTCNARFWSKSEKVTVITCFPNHPTGKIFKKYAYSKFFIKEVHGNLTILRVWSFISRKDNSYLNFIDYLSFGITSFVVALFIKTDIVIGTSPPMPVAFFSVLVAKIKRVKILLEMRDLWVDSIKELKVTKSKFIINTLYSIENIMLKNSNKILCTTESIKNKIIRRGINKQKILVRPNGYSDNSLYQNKIKILIQTKKKYLNILYFGTIGFAQDFNIIFNIAKSFEKKINFFIIGNGSQVDQLINRVKIQKIKNIFVKKVNEKKLDNSTYKKFDFGLSSLKNCNVFKTVIPSKLYDYASKDLPILFIGPKGDAHKLIKKFHLGVCSSPNLFQLKKKLNNMFKNKVKNNNYILKKNKYFKSIFKRESIAKDILDDIYKK